MQNFVTLETYGDPLSEISKINISRHGPRVLFIGPCFKMLETEFLQRNAVPRYIDRCHFPAASLARSA